jgi:uncharacterized membrane protein
MAQSYQLLGDPMVDTILLILITIQGFFVMYFEWSVWAMNKHRFEERAEWRQAKRKQAEKLAEKKAISTQIPDSKS